MTAALLIVFAALVALIAFAARQERRGREALCPTCKEKH